MSDYDSVSKQFAQEWNSSLASAGLADIALSEMLEILKMEGYARTAAINKIVADHKELKGFSRMTIYRQLPAEEKRQYLTQSKTEKPKKLNVSNDTIYASDTEESTSSEVPEADALPELENIVSEATKQIANEIDPPRLKDANPPQNDPTPEQKHPTDENEEYHGDAKQKENLPRWIRIELTKLLPGTSVTFLKKLEICMASGGIAYFGLLDENVIAVESAGEHLRKVRAMEATI